ncbi:hypothetical protein AB1Y20_020286 [Prymnesium parvum]|uniref:Major facilitator superfamily (MFS) profile domain-containing protein n=1 Tax=Prymnesium parvum TaxID=97485 RepID=A0AB34JWX9_PRYPA
MDVCGKFPEHSGLLLGALQATGFLALAVGPAIGGALADRSGPALPFVLFGVLQLLSAAVKCLLPETLPLAKRKDASLKGLRQVMDGLWASYRRLLVDRKQTGLLAVKCSFLAGLSLVLTIVPLHAAAAWSASAADVGALTSFAMLLCLIFSPIAGVLADRVGSEALIIGGSLVSAASVACMPCAKSKASYYFVRALWAAGEAYLITAYSTLALNITPEDQRGARNSLDNQVGDIALLFLVVLVGVIGGKSLNMAFWATSGFMLLCNVFFVSRLQAA